MIDASAYKDLMDALMRVFDHQSPNPKELGPDEGKGRKEDLIPPKKSVTIVSVKAADKSAMKIPKSAKKDSLNDKSIGSGKTGGKGE